MKESKNHKPRKEPGSLAHILWRQLCCFCRNRTMRIMDLFGPTAHDFQDLGPKRFDSPFFPQSGAVKQRFRYAAAIIFAPLRC